MKEFKTVYAKPSRFFIKDYGTIVKVFLDRNEEVDNYKYYIQTSKDRNRPLWMPIGDFFEEAFIKYIEDKNFIKKCLELFL